MAKVPHFNKEGSDTVFNKHKQKILIVLAFILGIIVQFINPLSMLKQEVEHINVNAISNYTIGDVLYIDAVIGDTSQKVDVKELKAALKETKSEKITEGIVTGVKDTSTLSISFDMKEVKESFEVILQYKGNIFPVINSISTNDAFDFGKIRVVTNKEYLLSYEAKDLLQIENYNTKLNFAVSNNNKINAMVQDYYFDAEKKEFYISILQEKTNVGTEHVAFLNTEKKVQSFKLNQEYFNDKYIKNQYKVMLDDGTRDVEMYVKVTHKDDEAASQNPVVIKISLENESNRL